MMRRFAGTGSGLWVREAEHAILRLVSLAFSMASAYAIRVFFGPLDAVDPGEKVITWIVAIGFGVLGYVVSRGLVHRMMERESIWAYAPICFLVELVDISCNYVLAASVVHQAWWLNAVPENQRGVLTFITYIVLSAVPLVSLFLAVVDMDLERSKQSSVSVTNGKPMVARASVQPVAVRAGQGGSGNTTAVGTNGKEAKRATFFSNRQGQGNTSGGVRNMMNDPEKDMAVAGVS